jgi:hypothetical protein
VVGDPARVDLGNDERHAGVHAERRRVVVQTDINGDATYDINETNVTVVNGDGSRVQTITDTAASGTLLSKIVTTTSADGHTKTTQFDLDGNGTFDKTLSQVITVNADGSTVSTQTETNADLSLRDKVVTSISADGLSTTTQVDSNGDGVFDTTTTDVKVINGDGSITETIQDFNANGALRDKSVTVRGADGRSRTVNVDSNADAVNDQVETILVGASTVDTASLFSPGSTLIDKSATTTSADGLTVTSQLDVNGDGTFDATRATVTVHNADGSSTVTQTDTNANGSLRDRSVVTISANGLSATTQLDTTGAGSFNFSATDVIVVNGDGSRTETVNNFSANSTLLSKTVTSISADRKTTTLQIDGNGDGTFEQVRSSVENANGSTVLTTSDYTPNGTQRDRSVVTSSATGLSVTTQLDVNGDNVFDSTRSDVTTLNADGSRTETVADTNANGSLKARIVVTTSGNGLGRTTQTDLDGNGTFDVTRNDVTVLNADGSRTETISDSNYNGSLRDNTVIAVSATGLSVTTQIDADGNGTFDATRTDVTVLNSDGSRTETVTDTSNNGALRDKTITTTSADGNTVSITRDIDGDGTPDQIENDVLNTAGSRVRTISEPQKNGPPVVRQVITVAGNGLSTTTQRDTAGAGSFNQTMTDATVVNADGSRTETTTWLNADGSLHDKTITTTSASGLSTTTQQDSFAAGSYNRTESDVVTLNSDGTRVETAIYDNSNGALHYRTTTTTSADQKTVTVARDINGDGVTDQTRTTVLNANGNTVVTASDLNANGSVRDQTVTTTTATDLSITTQFAAGSRTDITVLGNDGSRTRTISDFNGSGGLKDSNATTTSANGLSQTSQSDRNGDTTIDATRSDVVALNNDGSRTETLNEWAATIGTTLGYHFLSVATTNANGLSKTTQWSTTGSSNNFDQVSTDATVLNVDGSRTETVSSTISGAQLSTWVANFAANGLSELVIWSSGGTGWMDESWLKYIKVNADGSRSVTVTGYYGSSAPAHDNTITTTSADGRTVSVTRDINADGTIDQSETDVDVPDGSMVRTVSNTGSGGTLLEKTVVTTSADALATTTTWDFDGNGTTDRTRTDVIVRNADGSRSETITATNSGGSLRQRSIITTSADGLTATLQEDKRGNGLNDLVAQTTINADGSRTTVTSNYSTQGALLDTATTTTRADGLVTTTSRNFSATGTTTQSTSTTNIDGSVTTSTNFINNSNAMPFAWSNTTTSADGRRTEIKKSSTNASWPDSDETRTTQIDGSVAVSLNLLDQSGTILHSANVTISADGRTIYGGNYELGLYLTPDRLSLLAEDTNLEFIHSTSGSLTLTAAQYAALGGLKLTPSDTVTLADTGANIASLSVAQFAAMLGTGVDLINATDNLISLAPAKYHALSGVGFTANTYVRTPAAVNDLNGDGLADILWRDVYGNLLLADWGMNGPTIASSNYVTAQGSNVAPGTNWVIKGLSDFDGNGTADVLWTDNNTGELVVWGMNGSAISWSADVTSGGSSVYLGPYPWITEATGDFDGNGTADILWRNANTGETVIWGMNGNAIAWSNDVYTPWGTQASLGTRYVVAGIGDFDGSGTSDILWLDSYTGEVWIWGMSGSQVVSSCDTYYQQPGGEAWAQAANVLGIGDFNGDGKSDILWRDSSNHIIEWQMNSAAVVNGYGYYATDLQGNVVTPDSSWHLVEIGDFNGDNKSDMATTAASSRSG